MGEGILLGPLILFAAAMCLTPGPNVVMIAAVAANFGFRRSLRPTLGITFGFGLMAMAAGLGLAGLFHAEPRAHAVLKYAGAVYMLYLAWRIGRAGASGSGSRLAQPIGFLEAALFAWVNPKGWVTAIGALATYAIPEGEPMLQTAIVASMLAAACLASLTLWAAFGAAIARFLGDPGIRTIFNWSMASLLAMSLIPVLW